MELFIVHAFRYGDRERHSYIVGVYDDVYSAHQAAIAEEYWRGGKYECDVEEFQLNTPPISFEGVDKESWCAKNIGAEHYALEVLTRTNQYLGEYD